LWLASSISVPISILKSLRHFVDRHPPAFEILFRSSAFVESLLFEDSDISRRLLGLIRNNPNRSGILVEIAPRALQTPFSDSALFATRSQIFKE
jgi:hypothetical protein